MEYRTPMACYRQSAVRRLSDDERAEMVKLENRDRYSALITPKTGKVRKAKPIT